MLLVFLALPLVSGLGINCRGCAASGGISVDNHTNAATQLTQDIGRVNQSGWFDDYNLIACVKGYDSSGRSLHVCAYLQGTGGALGSKLIELANYIPAHGCHACGSVPLTYPSENDVTNGELTYVMVNRPCLNDDGLCSSTGRRVNIRMWVTWSYDIYLTKPISPSHTMRLADFYFFAAYPACPHCNMIRQLQSIVYSIFTVIQLYPIHHKPLRKESSFTANLSLSPPRWQELVSWSIVLYVSNKSWMNVGQKRTQSKDSTSCLKLIAKGMHLSIPIASPG